MALLIRLDGRLTTAPILGLLLALLVGGCQAGLRTTFSGNRLPDIVPGQPGVDYPVASSVPVTQFRCDQQDYPGFFADPQTGCQVFHVCKDGKQTSFLCPNGTLYHQRFFVCDWWFNVDCSKSAGLYPLNKDYMQRQPQDRSLEIQPQATTLAQPTPTPSFARFEKRSASPSEPSFQEWATRHIPLTTPTDSSFKSPRMSSSESSRFRDAPVPFSDSPFRSFSSGIAGNIWPKDPTRPPRDRVAVSTTTTTTARSAPKQKERGSAEYPLSEFAPNNIPADKWFLLAKDPDFLNNIAWSAQLYINNKTKGAGYLRSKQNRKPTEQELEFHPFQGFNNGLNQGITKVQEAIRSERARPSFKPSPLLSMNKDRQDSVWTPSQFLSSTTPRSPPSFQPSSQQPPQPPTQPQQPPQPQQQQQPPQRPAQVQQQQFTPAAPKPTYPNTVPKQTQPYRPGPTTQQVTRPWTPQQVKKHRYQQSTGIGYGPGPAYQVTLTSASDYQVILTRPPPPTVATPKVTRPAPAQSTSASTPAVTRSRPQVQPPRVISPSQLPLESPPQLPYKYLRPPTRAPKSTNNQRSQQQTTPTIPTTTPRPPQPVQQQQQPAQQPQQAQASEQAIQISNADGQQVFRTTESEKITSKSVPIRPSVLLSAGGPSSRSPFEFEPGNKKWTVEPSTTRTTGSSNDIASNVVTGYYSTGSGNSGSGSFRSTAPHINNYVETDVIRGRLIPTSTAQLDPFQHNGEAFSSVDDRNVQSFVVRPRSPLTLASAL